MKKSSPLFRKLNCMTSCDGPFNRCALRLCRSFEEAAKAIPRRKDCCPESGKERGCKRPGCRNKK